MLKNVFNHYVFQSKTTINITIGDYLKYSIYLFILFIYFKSINISNNTMH